MKIKAPYLFILCFTLIVTVVRTQIISEFPWYLHLLSFFSQFGLLIVIWNINIKINEKLAGKFPIDEKPALRMGIQILLSLLIVSPVAIIPLVFLSPYLPAFVDNRVILVMIMLFFTVMLLIVFGMYTFDFFNRLKKSLEEKSSLELNTIALEKEKATLEFFHLKNQVNPHFLFNTLTSLDALIKVNPELASSFLGNLSKVFRYALENKDRNTVTLKEELEMFSHYTNIMEVRFENALQFHISFSEEDYDKKLPAVILQNLADNAIKHNIISTDSPLVISLFSHGEYWIMKNNIQPKKQLEYSSKQGLEQLKKLYGYLSHMPVQIVHNSQTFEIHLPWL